MFMIKPLKEALEESYTKIKEQEIAQLYASCYKTAWETTLVLEENGKSYVSTGDIYAMWLRDSAMQLLPYMNMADVDVVARALRGVVLQQAYFIQIDPYANAFNRKPDGSCFCADHTRMNPLVWERKYEVDSLAFFLFFLEAYFRQTKDSTVLTETRSLCGAGRIGGLAHRAKACGMLLVSVRTRLSAENGNIEQRRAGHACRLYGNDMVRFPAERRRVRDALFDSGQHAGGQCAQPPARTSPA